MGGFAKVYSLKSFRLYSCGDFWSHEIIEDWMSCNELCNKHFMLPLLFQLPHIILHQVVNNYRRYSNSRAPAAAPAFSYTINYYNGTFDSKYLLSNTCYYPQVTSINEELASFGKFKARRSKVNKLKKKKGKTFWHHEGVSHKRY